MHQPEAKRVIDLVEAVRSLKKALEAIERKDPNVTMLSETGFLIGSEPLRILKNGCFQLGITSIIKRDNEVYQVGYVTVRDLGDERYRVGIDGEIPVRVCRIGAYKIWDFYFNSKGKQFTSLDEVVDE